MSELAAAGAAFLSSKSLIFDHDQAVEKDEASLNNLAVPENDSISSSEDELEEDQNVHSSHQQRAKTLQPQASLRSSTLKTLKRSLTLPRKHALFRMKEDGISSSSPSKTSNPNRDHGKTVRNIINRVVKQIYPNLNNLKNGSDVSNVDERIAAWKRRFTDEDRVPGVIGIRNHGNTCFINAILQCLSYTDILAEYFVLDAYKSDLKRKKKLTALTALYKRTSTSGASSDFCSRGEVTEQLATLLKSLWSLQYDPEISIRFKSLVEKNASQYKGGSQHDAQEFLLWLLDRLHEDLNVASKRRYRKANSSGANDNVDPSDEVLAAESLANFMRCNNSFVMDIFQAQFRSSLTCPTCEKQSNTFDPFLCVSLPIPQKQLMPVFVTVLYIDQTPRQGKEHQTSFH